MNKTGANFNLAKIKRESPTLNSKAIFCDAKFQFEISKKVYLAFSFIFYNKMIAHTAEKEQTAA